MDDGPGPPPNGGEYRGYVVPPQRRAPPAASGPSPAGPPAVAPEDPAAHWDPAAAPSAEPDRSAGAPPHRYGGTALLDRTTISRRPVVAPPVRPLPAAAPAQSWEWEPRHRLRNALVAVAAILLVSSLIAAFVVFRHQRHDKKPLSSDPPTTMPIDRSLDPTAGGATATTGLPVIPPVLPVPVPPPATTAPPNTAAPSTTQAPVPPTTQRMPTPTVTASPPYTGGPFPTQKPTTTVPPTTANTKPG